MPLYSIMVPTKTGRKVPGMLGFEDVKRLRGLFPSVPVWEGCSETHGSIRLITVEQARALYDAIVTYYVGQEVSSEAYSTGFEANTRTLPALFDLLMTFFENELGFYCSVEERGAIVRKQWRRDGRVEQVRDTRLAAVATLFGRLGTLGPPSTEARAMLQEMLTQYKKDLGMWCQEKEKPAELFVHDPEFRKTTHRIFLIDALLLSDTPVSLREAVEAQIASHGDDVQTHEFFGVCREIASCLGVPFPPPRETVTETRL